MTQKSVHKALFPLIIILGLTLVGWRSLKEIQEPLYSRGSKRIIGTNFDPRGNRDFINKIAHRRESDAFKSKLRSSNNRTFIWPGLKSAQLSWTWLELLEGLHNESSYDGDFSWMFSKLYFLLMQSHGSERITLTALAPFYLVIGKDSAGATLFMNELIKHASSDFRVWAWSGFHALENLHNGQLAGFMYKESSKLPGSPPYYSILSLRLSSGLENSVLHDSELRNELFRNVDSETLSKIKEARPEWFK